MVDALRLVAPRLVEDKARAKAIDAVVPIGTFQSPDPQFTLGRIGFDWRIPSHALRDQSAREFFDVVPETANRFIDREKSNKVLYGGLKLASTISTLYLFEF